MLEENEEKNLKEENDIKEKNNFEKNSIMSVDGNLITRKKVKIKTLRRLNLDLPDELIQNDNESQLPSKPQSNNQVIESYGDLTHRSMFFPKPKKIENEKHNSTSQINNIKEIKNNLDIGIEPDKEKNLEQNNDNENIKDNFSNKDEEKDIKNEFEAKEEKVEKEENEEKDEDKDIKNESIQKEEKEIKKKSKKIMKKKIIKMNSKPKKRK